MKKIAKKSISAESIAKKAERGDNISEYFTNKGKMVPPIQRVNIDFTMDMLGELDSAAAAMNISRQALIKGFVRQALDQHYIAQQARKAG